MTPWHALDAAEALETLRSTGDGLTEAEAVARLRVAGPNALPEGRSESIVHLIWRQCRSAVVWLLLGGVVLAVISGERLDALAIGVVLVLNVAIGVGMESGAGRALRGLRALDTRRAMVVRDGVVSERNAPDLVPGDVIVLEDGVRVPADARLLQAAELRTVEGVLTGESTPVSKSADLSVARDAPLAERETMVYRGTTVAAGRARALVVATGGNTEIGRIGTLASGVAGRRTHLERALDRLGGQLAVVALGAAALVVILGALRGRAATDLLELGIALAVATVPEGLPVVSTIALAIGVRRMARRRALVRHLPSVEALGSVSVVCADKTGTLTEGIMAVTDVWCAAGEIAVSGTGFEPKGEFHMADGRALDVPGHSTLRTLIEHAALAARASVEQENGAWRAVGDPTDAALMVLAAKSGSDRDALVRSAPMAWEVPFSSAQMLSASVHRQGGALIASVKGAPRAVIDRCESFMTSGGAVPLGVEQRTLVTAANDRFAARGLRVLAIAQGPAGEQVEDPRHLTLLGLIGITDPPAPGVVDAIAALRGAGVRTVMITGDQRATATAIAQQLALFASDQTVLDASELSRLDDQALNDLVPRVGAFSRASPEDKLRIVDVLQRRGELVAMLGDGVNDAPALRRADIGVAMGRRGTDVARDAADIVLLDDRFPTIVVALEYGRVIFENLRKFVYYLVSCNLAEVLAVVAFPLVGMGIPFTALQLLWLNLVTDVAPALALAAEPGDPLVMQRPPYPSERPIMTRALLASAAAHAAVLLLVTIAGFTLARATGGADAPTMAFLTLAMAQIAHLGNARSTRSMLRGDRFWSNRVAVAAAAFSVALIVFTAAFTPLARVLALRSIGIRWWGVVFALGAVPAIAGQVWRMRAGRRTGGA